MTLLNFSWVVDGKLAGMARPLSEDRTFEELTQKGVRAIVSLTERPLAQSQIDRHGFNYLHLPVPDFTPPRLPQIVQFVHYVNDSMRHDRPVMVHCTAGCGRTGTMLACYFVSTGLTPEDAYDRIVSLRPGSVETSEQKQCIFRYAEFLRSHPEDEE